MKSIVKEKLYYLKNAVFHPFDAFYEIRFRGKGSTALAALILVLFGILQCVSYQYTGFIINTNDLAAMNSVSIFMTWVLGLILFIVSNWSVTTLLSGKGNLTDILKVTAYSLVPMMCTLIFQVFASNFIIMEEAMIVYVVTGIGTVWTIFMLLAGLCVIHEYGFGKTLIAIFLTFVAAAIIMFLGILFFTLIEQMVIFVVSVGQEFLRRL
ncbi:MAG: YIP1 family protein [Lachnospiraceae bacterium]|nr:YIP1 family protein [Lachnospiraceae bacterium]